MELLREIYTYNKYHLLIYDQQISDRTGHLLSEIRTISSVSIDRDNGCAHITFSHLPVTYSLPLKIVTNSVE